MKIKKFFIIGFTALLLSNNFTFAYAKEPAKNEITVKNKVTLAAAPYILDDQIMIPVRSFANSLNCIVKWNGKDKTDTILKEGKLLYKIQVNSDVAMVKGKRYKLKNQVELKDGKIFVEAAFLSLVHQVSIETDRNDIHQYVYKFNKGNSGFEAIFSDYQYNEAGNYDIYEMKSEYKLIPVKDSESKGLYLAAHNRSDDLFMGYVKKISGLSPNTEYSMNIKFQLATNAESNGMGIGGSPSSSVYVKCGAAATKPESILNKETGTYRMNIDIGQQSQEGKNIKVVGDLGKTKSSSGFEFKTMPTAIKVMTDKNGSAYIIIGTDSGFEGFTEYYIDNVTISIK